MLGGNRHKSAEPMGLRDQRRPQTLWKSLEPLQPGSDIMTLPIEATLGGTMWVTLNPRQGTKHQTTEHAGSGPPWPLHGSHGAAWSVGNLPREGRLSGRASGGPGCMSADKLTGTEDKAA